MTAHPQEDCLLIRRGSTLARLISGEIATVPLGDVADVLEDLGKVVAVLPAVADHLHQRLHAARKSLPATQAQEVEAVMTGIHYGGTVLETAQHLLDLASNNIATAGPPIARSSELRSTDANADRQEHVTTKASQWRNPKVGEMVAVLRDLRTDYPGWRIDWGSAEQVDDGVPFTAERAGVGRIRTATPELMRKVLDAAEPEQPTQLEQSAAPRMPAPGGTPPGYDWDELPALLDKLLHAAGIDWADQPPVTIEVRREVGLILVAILQALACSPEAPAEAARLLTEDGRRVQAQVLAGANQLGTLIDQLWPDATSTAS